MNWLKKARKLSPEEIDMYTDSPEDIRGMKKDLSDWIKDRDRVYEIPASEKEIVQKGDYKVLQQEEENDEGEGQHWWTRWYDRYARNMENGDKSPGSYEGIFHYLTSPDTVVFRSGKTAIWGKEFGGIFLPSHVSPGSKTELYSLIKHVSARQPVVFAVTPEIGFQLSRIGFKQKHELSFPHYRGGIKEVWANDSASKIIDPMEPERILEMMRA